MAKEYREQSSEVKKVIYDLACEFGFEHYSTPEEIDYKFWEDIPAEWIAIALAQKLVAKSSS
jgi:hypothetical protein